MAVVAEKVWVNISLQWRQGEGPWVSLNGVEIEWPEPPPVEDYLYLQPGGVDKYLQPDGTSYYLTP